jgi:hypothetical protein
MFKHFHQTKLKFEYTITLHSLRLLDLDIAEVTLPRSCLILYQSGTVFAGWRRGDHRSAKIGPGKTSKRVSQWEKSFIVPATLYRSDRTQAYQPKPLDINFSLLTSSTKKAEKLGTVTVPPPSTTLPYSFLTLPRSTSPNTQASKTPAARTSPSRSRASAAASSR